MNAFVSFLKKFGLDAVKAVEAVVGAPKVIVQDVLRDSTDLKMLFNLVKTSEAMYAIFAGKDPSVPAGSSGSAKLSAITPDALAIVGDIEVLAGTRLSSIIKDQAEFNGGVQDLISAIVRISNACGQ
jgi:hypothetical protein